MLILARDFHRFGQNRHILEKLDTSLLRHKSKNKRNFDPEPHFTFIEDLKNVYEKGTFEQNSYELKLPNKNPNHNSLNHKP